MTDRLAVGDEDPDSFDDFTAQCRWYRDGLRETEQGLVKAHVVRLFAARGGKTWNLILRLDHKYLREWFHEDICRPAIPEMTKFLDEYFFRFKRNEQE